MPAATPPTLDRVVDGRYRVGSHLAEGGMASVYRATDLRLDRPVALKVMRPDLARDPDFVARFRREARSAARLSHPHVVSVYDQGADDDLVFLAMELVDGPTLRDIIAHRSPLTVRQACELVDPVLQAIGAAHAAGIVHRDIKPENVLISTTGEVGDAGRAGGGSGPGTVKVADFGLARAVTASSMSRTSDLLWGTAAYLSPEQVEHGRADERTDVYAVGLLLFELLTGVKAFPGESPVQVAYQHVHGAVPVPTSLVPTVPGAIADLIAWASATDPEQRPTDARPLLSALRRTVAGLPDHVLDREPGDDPDRTAGHGAGAGASAPDHDRTTPVQVPTMAVTPGRHDGGFARTTGNNRSGPAAQGRQHRPRRTAGWVLGLLLVLVGTGGAAATWWFTAGPGIHSTVPALEGLSEQEARAALDREDLDALVQQRYSETVPADVVLGASVPTGEVVRHGTEVTVAVSLGPERYAVPALVGRTAEEAETDLATTGLVVGSTTQRFDEQVPEGTVLTSSPAESQELRPGTEVDLVVSAGPEPVAVPSLTGTPVTAARTAITDAGLAASVESDRVFDDTVPEGSVVSQSPAGGNAHRGDTVTLVVSKGPELVTVPSVVGRSWSRAEDELSALGLSVTREDLAGGYFETVRFQSVDEGEQVPVGSEVVLTVL